MDPETLGPEEAALQRAKLHIRAGKRRLRQGKISAGIITLFDALNSAMRWYTISSEKQRKLYIREGDNINDEETLFKILVRSEVIDGIFDYQSFYQLVEKALSEEMSDYNYQELLKDIESVMTQLGVMPFEESKLPSEDPYTY
ncbi:MAG: hypothetical protein ACFFC7_33820 [Candidatus Hermodarchaeota archaeon]